MTLEEFDRRSEIEPCNYCGAPVELERNPNNNALQVVCGSALCKKRRAPWGLVINVKQTAKKHRKDYPDGQGLYEVWERFKGRCVVCTLPMAHLLDIRIGLSRHHVAERYDPSEYDCPIVPVCNACKPFVDARQREAWRWIHRLQEVKGESVPASRAGVPAPRVHPDSMRAEAEAPVGAVEGLADDDADA